MIGAWRALPALVQDAVLAAMTTLVTLGVPLLGGAAPGQGGLTPLWGVLVCAVCAPLAVRRRLPLAAALASGAAVLLAIALGVPQVGAWVTVAAFGSAAYHRDRGRLPLAIAATCWLVVLDLMLTGMSSRLSPLLTAVAAGLAPVALGHALRLHRDRTRHLALVERARERARIARDVHDVVGHHLSAIRLQAVGARRGTPADADHALEVIAEISATALGETRRLLGLLRDGDGDGGGDGGGGNGGEGGHGGGDDDVDLGSLVARLSRQGLRVRLHGDSLRDGVSSRVRHTAYRIVQESLTNVMRHSGASRATVRVDRGFRAVMVVVEDRGRLLPGGAAVPEGGGVRGMRERAALLGGTLTAGPRHPHGWRVTARLPLEGIRTREERDRPGAAGRRVPSATGGHTEGRARR
ncbi:sensor histidine kinase [Streptosporangium sp. NBC_01469]|uniref:sensor histidine kinase n=1 Tax=Streptosporangium sp. NBC_01469 TaxID=2903898 RepID=UPI002E2CCDB3|nr:histidine kinase [Streptosporangium sp. NBC_01469]